ncbi:MAG: proton-conducting transporter membrane subunit [Bryobacteraceae bacterium]
MPELLTPQTLLTLLILSPGILFLAMGLLWLVGVTPSEKATTRTANATYGFTCLAFLGLVWPVWSGGLTSVSAGSGDWYAVHEFQIPLVLFADRLSLPLIGLTSLLVGLVAVFSRRYLHRERGFFRFFMLLHLFAFGSLLVFAAGSVDLLIGGWEIICVSSTLLVAFFHERPEPVKSAIRVYATYRGCDVGIMAGAFFLHHWAGSTLYPSVFPGQWPAQSSVMTGGSATIIGLLLLLGAMGKSAQVPFSGWLPRAMEGPTPSSAIFYGAISVHAGAYLLLRAQPLLASSSIASAAVIIVCAFSAVHGTMVARASSDAKTSLAYSSISQLGLIFMEIGAGFSWLPLVHICGHAVVRTLQFLKAPSALHEFHGIHAAAGGHLPRTGAIYESVLPAGLRVWLYRLAIDRGHHDALLGRFPVGVLRGFARRMTALEVRWLFLPRVRPNEGSHE